METIRRTVLIIMEELADMPADTQMGTIHRIVHTGMGTADTQMGIIRRTVRIIAQELADMPAVMQMVTIRQTVRTGMETADTQMEITRRTARIGMEPVVIQMEITRRTARIGAEARVIPEAEAVRVMADTMAEDIMEGVTIDGDYEEVRRKCAVKQK